MATLSPFLTLPLELRNQIYTLLLPSSKPIRLLQKHTDQPEEHYHSMYWKQKMLSLPILHTNKQISFEARKVLLERNIIVLRNDIFGLPSKEILETMKGVRKVKINLDKMEGAEEVVEWLVSVGRLDWLYINLEHLEDLNVVFMDETVWEYGVDPEDRYEDVDENEVGLWEYDMSWPDEEKEGDDDVVKEEKRARREKSEEENVRRERTQRKRMIGAVEDQKRLPGILEPLRHGIVVRDFARLEFSFGPGHVSQDELTEEGNELWDFLDDLGRECERGTKEAYRWQPSYTFGGHYHYDEHCLGHYGFENGCGCVKTDVNYSDLFA